MWEKIKYTIVVVLATLGVLFIVIMLLPDDEASESPAVATMTVRLQTKPVKTQHRKAAGRLIRMQLQRRMMEIHQIQTLRMQAHLIQMHQNQTLRIRTHRKQVHHRQTPKTPEKMIIPSR